MIRKRILPSGWYPQDEKKCIEQFKKFDEFLEKKEIKDINLNVKSIIVPHAGWEFSGYLGYLSFLKAAEQCKKEKRKVDTIVFFGGHMKFSEKTVILNYDGCETPFGNILIDKEILIDYKKIFDTVDETSIFSDNTIEINLPFIKYFFPEAKLFALYPPLQEAISIAQFIANKTKDIVAVASADLTHYGPNYGFTPHGTGEKSYLWAKENDALLIQTLEKMDYDSIENIVDKYQNSCSPNSLTTAIAYASLKGSKKGYCLLYGSSYEIFPSASFVGYLSFIA